MLLIALLAGLGGCEIKGGDYPPDNGGANFVTGCGTVCTRIKTARRLTTKSFSIPTAPERSLCFAVITAKVGKSIMTSIGSGRTACRTP